MENKIELLKVSQYALNQYKRFVIGAWNLSDEEVRKKLHRNYILGCGIKSDNPEFDEIRAYGNLYLYRKDYEIVKIGNGHGKCTSWVYINTREKNDLNLILGIK